MVLIVDLKKIRIGDKYFLALQMILLIKWKFRSKRMMGVESFEI